MEQSNHQDPSYLQDIKSLLSELGIDDPARGLDAEQAKTKLEEVGYNRLKEKKRKSLFRIFLAQLNDALIYVLLIAVAITMFMGEYTDGVIILAVVFLNAVLGVIQEIRAGNAIDALRKMSQPQAYVKRDGQLIEIDAELLVPGDIVQIEVGSYVPADLRLLETHRLQVDESALTGESIPSEKDAEAKLDSDIDSLGDQINLAFMSTLVTYGRGIGVVVNTGGQTEIGRIAGYLETASQDRTPLEIRLNHLGKTLGKVAVLICLSIFVFSYFQGRDLTEMFLTAVSLAVAAIPEGLAAIVAIVLSVGVTKMAKQKAIIKKLPAVETLGSVTVVCSDKTGTLTQNRMTVKEAFTFGGGVISVEDPEEHLPGDNLLAQAMVLSSDATLSDEKGTGDPTEIALLTLGDKWNIDRDQLHEEQPRIDEIAFDSDRKMMSTLHEKEDTYYLYSKGAVDNLLPICSYVLENGEPVLLEDAQRDEIQSAADDMSDRALRTLGVAYKKSDRRIDKDDFEKEMTFIGLVGMIDPPRQEVAEAIEQAKKAGVITVMITGDHANTALAIARDLGIAEHQDQVLGGSAINRKSQAEFAATVSDFRVFARVSPEHKVKIVEALKKQGNVVSMTGDGVNDAPSLQAADIGVAMGITGTDVAKNAADMILADDNFTTIIRAVEQGRNIYNNIKKSVIFLLSSNVGEVVVMLLAILAGLPVPLLATQLLWINLVTDTLPAVALGMDPSDPSVMKNKPRAMHENFFSHGAGRRVILAGALIGLVTLAAFLLAYHQQAVNPWVDGVSEAVHRQARTMAFLTIIAAQLFYSLSFRHERHSIFTIGLFSNPYLAGAILMGFALQLLVLLVPVMRESFKLQLVGWQDWLLVLALGIIPLLADEVLKWIRRTKKARK